MALQKVLAYFTLTLILKDLSWKLNDDNIKIFYFYKKFRLKNLPENTIQLYLIKIAKWFNLVMPIVFLFYQENGLSMSQIFLLKSVYSIAMVVCRTLTAAVSKTRMRFKHPIDPVGGPIVGLIAAWVLTAFTMATLHTAPLGKDVLGGSLVRNDSDIANASSITSPDLGWLRFFARVTGSNDLGFGKSDDADRVTRSVRAFVRTYEDHRAEFDNADKLIVSRTRKAS